MTYLGTVDCIGDLWTREGKRIFSINEGLVELVREIFDASAMSNSASINKIYDAKYKNGKIEYRAVRLKDGDLITSGWREGERRYEMYVGNPQVMNVGKFLKAMDIEYTQAQIDAFIGANTYDIEFDIVEKDLIPHYYLADSYDVGSGTLAKSCMRYEESQPLIKAYAKFNVKLAIMKRKQSDKIIGRVLLWEAKNEDTGVMEYIYDRLYCPSTLKEEFSKFLFEAGYEDVYNCIAPLTVAAIEKFDVEEKLPYLDNFSWFRYDMETRALTLSTASDYGDYEAQETSGARIDQREVCDICGKLRAVEYVDSEAVCVDCLDEYYVYSDWNATFIHRDAAYTCEVCDGYFYEHQIDVACEDNYSTGHRCHGCL